VNDDDRRLIADCLGGRRDAFGELVTRYQARLYNAALRLVHTADDAADVVQDAFLNAFQSLHTFKGDAEFFTWLYRIAFNTAISLKRKKRPSVSLEAHAGEAGIDPDDPSEYVKPGAALERTEDERQLTDAIARLSAEHREVLLLKDIEGLKYEDIAELLAVPIGTIRSRLHRARLELRELLVPLEERAGQEIPDDPEVTEPTPLEGGDEKPETDDRPPRPPPRRVRRAE
jgi:RNA polymerase sigma-70 factor, ECF subfamily